MEPGLTPTPPNSAPPVADLRAAAELVRSKPTISNKYDNAASKLARAWLAEHPTDDDDPITPEWLLSVGFKAVPSDMGSTYHDHYQLDLLNLWQFNGGPWLVNGADWMEFKTRVDVRRLTAALSLPLKESP